MILSATHITKSFGSETIIRDASLLINEHEKVAIVGLNGAGKTTLLRILSRENQPDAGSVILSKDAKLGYLHQINDIDSDYTIQEELYTVIEPIIAMEEKISKMEEQMKHLHGEELEKLYDDYNHLTHQYELADGYVARSKVSGILKGLGFSENDFQKKIHSLSGGQKTRVFLGKLLLSAPDIILLDEPTNHLDLSSIEWLEGYLLNYKGAVVIVSHDRYFLDKIVGKVIDVENGEVNTYLGNYTAFAQKKAMLREAALKAYMNQQQEIKHQEAVIEKLRSFNREKSIKRAESREKMLDKITRIDKPIELKSDMSLFFTQSEESGNDVLKVSNLSKSFGNQQLFSNLHFEIKRGEHVAIIGDNGAGKTTILKMLNHMISPDTGSITFGSRIHLAYYDQEHQVLHMEKTLFDEVQDSYPNLDNTRVRNILAAFLFTGDDVYKKIADLSGGERGRVSLVKLMLSKANVLLLDEPTNHLDIVSKEILENAIANFTGTVIYVSHDRYFINRTANRILDLRHKQLFNYIGNYDYYLEKKEITEAAHRADIDNVSEPTTFTTTESKSDWKSSKALQAEQRKRKNAITRCEKEIEKLEEWIAKIDEQFLDPELQTNAIELARLQKEKEEHSQKLNDLYLEWEELSSKE